MQDALMSSQLRVTYLGPPASFSHQAAREAFPDSSTASLHPLPSFASIFSVIQNSAPTEHDKASQNDEENFDFALLPVENSTNGGVVQVLDLLIQCGLDPASSLYPDVEVVAEHYLEVHHCLYVHKDTLEKYCPEASDDITSNLLQHLNITTLYSHPQVWGQCNRFLAKHLPRPKVEHIDVSSTSAAALFVAKNPHDVSDTAPASDGTIGAICSSLAGTQNDLACLASNIEDEPGKNTTRFLIVRNRNRNRKRKDHTPVIPSPCPPPYPTSQPERPVQTSSSRFYKSLISFSISNDQLGALASALAVFSAHAFNLTAITTRPSRELNWHYVFFVECIELKERRGESDDDRRHVDDGDDSSLRRMLGDLARVTERMCLLGSWADSRRNVQKGL